MNFTAVSSASRSIPFEIDTMTSAPSSAPHTDPRPPNRLTPATTGPAIDIRSRSPPPLDWFNASSRDLLPALRRTVGRLLPLPTRIETSVLAERAALEGSLAMGLRAAPDRLFSRERRAAL